jgi:hypothetical protein
LVQALLLIFCFKLLRESKPITERTQFQKERLAIEKSVLERCWPGQVTWIDPAGESKVEVSLITNNGNRYFLRLYLEPDFPYSAPDMVRILQFIGNSILYMYRHKRSSKLELCKGVIATEGMGRDRTPTSFQDQFCHSFKTEEKLRGEGGVTS